MKIINTAIGGIVVGCAFTYQLMHTETTELKLKTAEQKPLYWVAPMDPNFRRNQPGKSPMGMDLIPVFADDAVQNAEPGIIKINPNTVNNMGVKTSEVRLAPLDLTIDTVGYVQYNEDTLVHIHPRVEGWIDKLYVKTTGQAIVKGEPLYALYSPQLVNAQEEFLLAQKRQNANLIAASLERLKALQMPLSSIEKLTHSGQVQQTVIFSAPQSGVVDNLNIREGFYVKPGTTLLSIGSLDEVWVEAEIFERQAAQVKTNLNATMTLGFLPTEEWQGKIDYIYPTLDPITRTLRVRLRFNNPQRLLKPNMFAHVTIHRQLSANSLLVPRDAVIRSGSQDRVVVALGDGQFKSVAVQLGIITNQQAQILKGLSEGEHVVSSAQFLLDSESSITSDFKRMDHAEDTTMNRHALPEIDETDQQVLSAMVNGQILNIDSQNRVLTVARDAIEKWQRPAATIDFRLADNVNIAQLTPQQNIHFTFEVRQKMEQATQFVIVQLAVLDQGTHL